MRFLWLRRKILIRIEIPDKHDTVRQIINGLKECQIRLPKVRFWLLDSSRSIAKASLSVMILKSLFLYSLFTTWPCFTRMATPPYMPDEQLFLKVS